MADVSTLSNEQLMHLVQLRGEMIHKLADAINDLGAMASQVPPANDLFQPFVEYSHMLGLEMAKAEEMIVAGHSGASVSQ